MTKTVTAPTYEFGSKQQAAELLSLTNTRSLIRYRQRANGWIEGVHWVYINSRVVSYNLTLIQHWIATRSRPSIHQDAIDTYLKWQEEGTKKSRRRAG